jgi:hypothetical protein
MDVLKKITLYALVGVLFGIFAAFFTNSLRESYGARDLDRQRNAVDREFGEGQRELQKNLGELGELSENAIAAAERAREALERTGGTLRAVATNLRPASSLLKDITVQVIDLQMELDSCRADLYRLRALVRTRLGEQVVKEE